MTVVSPSFILFSLSLSLFFKRQRRMPWIDTRGGSEQWQMRTVGG